MNFSPFEIPGKNERYYKMMKNTNFSPSFGFWGTGLRCTALYFSVVVTLLLPAGLAAVPIRGPGLEGTAALDARLSLIAAAESYLGVPYRYAGLDQAGLDCSGLVYLSFRDALKAPVPRTTEAIYAWAEAIPQDQLRIGDLVFFITAGQGVSHVGIYAGNRRFIHAASDGPRTGVMYSGLDEAYWNRTYQGAGRALPWDNEAERALAEGTAGRPESLPIAAASAGESSGGSPGAEISWTSSRGVFTGLGLAWTWGGFFKGAPSVFRGLAGQVKIGYKGLLGRSFQAALEIRSEYDRALGIIRLPLTVSIGSDKLQVFAGPAFTFGDPQLNLDGGRDYHPAFSFLGELGVAAAFPPIRISRGALSIFGEIAWQPYFGNDGEGKNLSADLTANLRVSTGARYLWLLKKRG
jgi:probable lipoprotein NlpC